MPQNNFFKSQLPQKQLSTLPTNKYLLVFESRTIEDSADTSFSRKKIKSLKAFGPLNILKLPGLGKSDFSLRGERQSRTIAQAIAYLPGGRLENRPPPPGTCLLPEAVWPALSSSP